MTNLDREHRAEVRILLAASLERIWAALTVADELAAWYWPPSLKPKVFSEPVVGGRFSVGSTASGIGFSGKYVTLHPPHRMEQTWRWDGDDRASRVRIDLVSHGEGTELHVTHDQVDAATAEAYQQGWESCLSRLITHLSSGLPPESGDRDC